jgi:CheY-like chemotaxis protein
MSTKSRFEIVPIAEALQEDARELSDQKPQFVLVVDDERIIADTLSMILTRSGFATMTAYDGFGALQLATDTPPALVITDVMMPGMTGVELAIAITETLPECKILLFSGQAATVDLLQEARGAGYDFTTLTKPVHPTDMLRRVQECLTLSAMAEAAQPSFTPSFAVN